jgi:8-oxo-dGTP pyrophosphatase MutT (NUDIX family)
MLFDQIRKLLSTRTRSTIKTRGLTPAAVLVLLYEKEGETHILFTKRTETVADHKGQISFPGGVCDKEDESLEATALREAFEEVGIEPEQVEILGALDDCLTVATSYVITPVVGIVPTPPRFSINPEEVKEVIEIPLSFFQHAVCNPPEVHSPPGYPTYHYGKHVIWGATARIVGQFLSLLAPLLLNDEESG